MERLKLESSNFVSLQAISNFTLRTADCPERGVARVTWSILEFYMPLNFSGVDEHRIIKFSVWFGPRRISLVTTNCPPCGRGQGHLTSLLFDK